MVVTMTAGTAVIMWLGELITDRGVGTSVHYPSPVPAQGLFEGHDSGVWPEASRAAREVVSLPCFAELTDDEIDRVAAAVRLTCQRL